MGNEFAKTPVFPSKHDLNNGGEMYYLGLSMLHYATFEVLKSPSLMKFSAAETEADLIEDAVDSAKRVLKRLAEEYKK